MTRALLREAMVQSEHRVVDGWGHLRYSLTSHVQGSIFTLRATEPYTPDHQVGSQVTGGKCIVIL